MQRILRLTLLLSAILLACVSGCGGRVSWEEVDFKIDNSPYQLHWEKSIQHDQVIWSYLSLHRVNTEPLPHGGHIVDSPRGRFFEAVRAGDKNAGVKTETLYFEQDNKIVFEKTYQELGIDAARLNTENSDEVLAYLQPILEPLIREHVQPQDTETEEQEK